MDPLSAVSLAGTVVQFLDFGIKLVAKASEIYSSASGAEIRNIELDAIARNLVSLNQRVRNRSTNVSAQLTSEDEEALAAMMETCSKIGEELIAAIHKAKVQGIHKGWKSVRQALKSVLGLDKIQDLYNRLTQYREQIVVILLVIISAKQARLNEDSLGHKQDMADSESRIIDEARQSRFQILNAIRQSQYRPDRPQDVSTVSALLSDMVSRTSDKQETEALLNSLYYPHMKDRWERISEAHAKTFDWALQGTDRGPRPWSDLGKWLRQQEGIYWISGKAGSGKSTLMKYIDLDSRTKNYLKEWASPMPLVVASFYFWNPGTSIQKSQLGLLRSLLFEILMQRKGLIPQAFPNRWLSFNSSYAWTLSELSDALKLIAETELKTRFCFIVDGLDEFDGDHQELIDKLFRLVRSGNIKILASSRPWLVFQDAFERCPKLVLQDLTRNDIKIFTNDSLYNHSKFNRLLELEPDRAPKLVSEIVIKASGVFLWVYLVVKSLMEGLTNADRISDLQRRLDKLPADLEQYFLHILTSLDPFYLHQASQLFRLALEARKPLSILTFSYLDEDDPDFALKRDIRPISPEEEAARCETIDRRLNSRCRGLLESRPRTSCDEYSNIDGIVGEQVLHEVDFLHRTVRDFLTTPTVSVKLVALDTPDFDANLTLTKAFVAQIKGLRAAAHPESNFQLLWSLVFDVLYHVSRVGESVPPEAHVSLLDELDQAAGHFRHIAIVKRRCNPNAHWTNTGYRFGLEPEWENDLLSLCVQRNLMPYVKKKLNPAVSLHRSGRPLLAFAMTNLESESGALVCTWEKPSRQSARIPYNAPKMEMVKFLLDRGGDPNGEDGKSTVWTNFLMSIYTLATIPESQFYTQTQDWFEVARLLVTHGADAQVKCTMSVPIGKLAERINLKKEESKKITTYSALEIIRLVFGGDVGYDATELEDLLQQKLPHPMPGTPDNSKPTLEVPGDTTKPDATARSRTVSGSSQLSQLSNASWHRPPDQNIVVPLQATHSSQNQQAAAPSVSSTPSKQKRHLGLGKWFHTKKDKTPPMVLYNGT